MSSLRGARGMQLDKSNPGVPRETFGFQKENGEPGIPQFSWAAIGTIGERRRAGYRKAQTVFADDGRGFIYGRRPCDGSFGRFTSISLRRQGAGRGGGWALICSFGSAASKEK